MTYLLIIKPDSLEKSSSCLINLDRQRCFSQFTSTTGSWSYIHFVLLILAIPLEPQLSSFFHTP